MAKNIIFSFSDMGTKKDSAARAIVRTFKRAGADVVQTDIPSAVKRTAGISYREMSLTFADSQVVTFVIKQSGDIFQVKINGKLFPIKNQDDQAAAIGEIVRSLDSSRVRFQAAMAKVRITLPAGIRTAAPRVEAALEAKSKALDEAIQLVQADLVALG